MNRKNAWLIFFLIVLVLLIIVVMIYYFSSITKKPAGTNNTLTIANWNLQIFGDSKEQRPEVMNKYADVIRNFDIVFVQEIRDIDGTAFQRLCDMLPDYNCEISSRAGRSNSKEQYGIIYLNDVEIVYMHDFNPDFLDRWERPPIRSTFEKDGYHFTVYNIHTKPDDAQKEISKLEELVRGEMVSSDVKGNVIIIGDLNADCSYYPSVKDFMDWTWVIKDNEDTTTGNSDCAYDRIIMNKDSYAEFVEYGIYKSGVDSSLSDHYPIWVRIKDDENIVKGMFS
jgi:deoxyribonuclease-1-like protein